MKFYIDTANVDEIRKANDMGIIAGVTTNPSLMPALRSSRPTTPRCLGNEVHTEKPASKTAGGLVLWLFRVSAGSACPIPCTR